VKHANAFALHPGWRIVLKDLGIRPADVLRRAGLPDDLLTRESVSLGTAQYFAFWRGLEEEAADLFGFESALFVPTGTMANQIAIRIWCSPGEIILADREAHVATNEAASTAGLNGAAMHLLDGVRGHLDAQTVAAALHAVPRSRADRRVGLVWLENTHNRAGGTVMPEGWTRAIAAVAREHGVSVHVDGARIWNTLVAHAGAKALEGTAVAAAIVDGADSLTVNLNKAVGAPVGSLVLGDRAFIEEAVRVRRMFGGWWRPVGPLAAAARVAMQGFHARLEADHLRTQAFARRVASCLGDMASVSEPDTNIVMLTLVDAANVGPLLSRLRTANVRASNYGNGRIRFVFHSRIADDDAASAADAVAEALGAVSDHA